MEKINATNQSIQFINFPQDPKKELGHKDLPDYESITIGFRFRAV